MPLGYLESLMERDQTNDWTFFALNGCPAALIMAMGRLAKLASIYEQEARMEWTTFNTFPVDLVVEEVALWKNPDDVSSDSLGETGEDADARRDRYLVAEAWRNAILLYARRVFKERQDRQDLWSTQHLTRVILDHVKCIPQTTTVQKQVLLPAFLAASECGEGPSRDFVRQYCTYWSSATRYSQFETALGWLESIWEDWSESGRDVYWWGCKVGGRNWDQLSSNSLIESELLLG